MLTVADRLRHRAEDMTRAERQLADALLDSYPMAGLGSITDLAERAAVSTPTVARMVQKLGFAGYGEFQAALREELEAMISSPMAKRAPPPNNAPDAHVFNTFAPAAMENLERTLAGVDPQEFSAFCAALADRGRRLHIVGGRITGAIAQYFYLHLQMMRPDVALVPAQAAWSHHVLDLGPRDLLIAFDVRRYENTTLHFVELAHEREAEIALLTDQWRSPIHRLARHSFAARIAVPSAWDSGLALMLLVECAIASVQSTLWDSVKTRADELESVFDKTRLFRKFN